MATHEMNQPVIALPGGIMPAALRYAPLESALGGEVDFHAKDLEVYAGDEPPPDYSVETEIATLATFADSLEARRFHLVGYSGGGFISLAFAGAYPERLLSLALFEPARVPGNLSGEEAALDATQELREALAGAQGDFMRFMRVFVSLQVRQGVEIEPPSGQAAPWMRNRPAGIAAAMRAFVDYHFDRNQLRNCNFPVFYGYGDLTTEMMGELQAAILGRLLPDIHIRRFSGIHHFEPPERIYTPQHLQDLRALWTRAENQAGLSREPALSATRR